MIEKPDTKIDESAQRVTALLKGFTRNKLKEMCDYYGRNLSAQITESINIAYTEFKKEAFGYHAGAKTTHKKLGREAKAEAQSEILSRIMAMSDEDLSKWLIEVEFFPRNSFIDESETIERRYCVRTEGEHRIAYETHFDLATNQEVFRSARFNWDELVSALKKEKKI